MKKLNLLFSFVLIFSALGMKGQNVPNGNFETWIGAQAKDWVFAGGTVSRVTSTTPIFTAQGNYFPYSGTTSLRMQNTTGPNFVANVSSLKFAMSSRPKTLRFQHIYLPQVKDERFGGVVVMTKWNPTTMETDTVLVAPFMQIFTDTTTFSTVKPWAMAQVDLQPFYRNWEETVGSNDSMPDTAFVVFTTSVKSPTSNTILALDEVNFNENGLGMNALNSRFEGIVSNSPNPFEQFTRIRYGLTETSKVSVSVFDVTGKLLAELMNETQEAGPQEIIFDGSSLKPGVYFYTIKAGDSVLTQKMTIAK